jgi:hypothetical protein
MSEREDRWSGTPAMLTRPPRCHEPSLPAGRRTHTSAFRTATGLLGPFERLADRNLAGPAVAGPSPDSARDRASAPSAQSVPQARTDAPAATRFSGRCGSHPHPF